MEPMIGEFKAAARELTVNPVTIPVISNVTGELAGDDFASADYWTQHIRAAVRFADSIRFANSTGASRFLEVGPGGGLTSSIEESLAEADIASVPLLRKDRPEADSLMAGVARAFVSGVGSRLACHACPAPDSSSCRPMRLSDAVSGCPPTTPRSTPRASGWRPASTRCWVRWSTCRPRAGSC